MSPANADEQDWSSKAIFSTGEAAQVCNVSQQTIIRCFDSGRLQGFRVPGSKFRRIPRDELIRFMEANGIPLAAIEGPTRRVLCVGRNTAWADGLAEAGAAASLTVRTAASGFEAGCEVIAYRPHVVVLDSEMHEVPIRALRERLGDEGTRLVVVGAFDGEASRAAVLEQGADEALGVPASAEALAEHLRRLVGLRPEGGDGGGRG